MIAVYHGNEMSRNKKVYKKEQWLCACVLDLCTFRPLQTTVCNDQAMRILKNYGLFFVYLFGIDRWHNILSLSKASLYPLAY